MELTVIIPVYNRAKMLSQALLSLRWQTYKNFMIIICDDNSKDNLQQVVENFSDLNIAYHRYDVNAGQFKNAMRGLELCKTPFVKYLDSDDLLFPEALEKQMKAFQEAPSSAICLGGIIQFEELSQQNTIQILNYSKPYVPEPRNEKDWAKLEEYNGFNPSACMYRTELFRNLGGFNTGLIGIADWEICVSLSSKYPVIAVDEPICAYRSHSNQITKNYFFNSDAVLSKDVLWMTSNANPYRERLGLPSEQLFFLRQNIFWENLRISLRSDDKLSLLKKWLEMANANQMLLPFILGFLLFAIRKVLRKPQIKVSAVNSVNLEKHKAIICSILFNEVLSSR
jgi:glycosyltransferase involved in cell wall biosynthesis